MSTFDDNAIKHNIEKIRERIEKAAERSGRKAEKIALMAVSKFHSFEEIQSAYRAGIRLFGENRVQEAVCKFANMRQTLEQSELHMIGTLQRNKVKDIVPLVSCIQSVDRIELLDEIAKQLHKDKSTTVGQSQTQIQAQPQSQSQAVKLLFEIHTGEESKAGFANEDDTVRALEHAEELKLQVTGFMTMAPFTEDRTQIRKSFASLRALSERMQKRFPSFCFTDLSMGMSGDFEIAVEEGSTMVRVGTSIFGTRT